VCVKCDTSWFTQTKSTYPEVLEVVLTVASGFSENASSSLGWMPVVERIMVSTHTVVLLLRESALCDLRIALHITIPFPLITI